MLEGAVVAVFALLVGFIAGWLYGFGRGVRSSARTLGMDGDDLVRRVSDRLEGRRP